MEAAPLRAAVSRKEAGAEVAFWLGVAAAYVVGSKVDVPVRYVIVVLGLALAGYLAFIWRRGRERLRDFGLRKDHLGAASVATGVLTLAVAAGFVAYAWAREVPIWRPEFAVLLPLYPLYGLAQQLAVQGIFHRRLLVLTESRALSAGLTAVAFGLLHTGNPMIFGLTTAGGLGWALLYQRYGNVWPLGLSHGVLASLAYPLVIGTNPLTQL